MKKGFTLIEILIVVVIIGILVSVLAIRSPERIRRIRIQMTKTRIATVKGAVQEFDLHLRRMPGDLNELLKEGDRDWPGPFLEEKEQIRDEWGTDMRLERDTKRILVRSAGPDREFNTSDDIVK